MAGNSGVNQPVGPVWLVVMMWSAVWLPGSLTPNAHMSTLLSLRSINTNELAHTCICTRFICEKYTVYTHKHTMYSLACIWPGDNKTCPGAHLSKCVIYGTQGPFECAALLPPLLWFCSLEESRINMPSTLFQTYCHHILPQDMHFKQRTTGIFLGVAKT